MASKTPKLTLTLPDYQRMHLVIASVLNSVEANTPKACLFFAVAGAFLIESTHKRPARPVVGAAFYRVNEATGFTMAFGRLESENGMGVVSSDEGAFHCWIESDGMVIDLMAPLFHESVRSAGRIESVARKMFQRPTVAMSQSPYDLKKEGDFFLRPDPTLGMRLLNGFISKLSNEDLVKVCEYWYKPLPKVMQSTIQMGSDDGSIRNIRLERVGLVGAW
jgi:hypothetical protein